MSDLFIPLSVFWSILTGSRTSPCFFYLSAVSLLKTLLEKEKLPVTSNFFLSNSVFYPLWKLSATFIEFRISYAKSFGFEVSKILWFGKGLKKGCWLLVYWKEKNLLQPFPKQALVFICLQYKSSENTVGKGDFTSNFSFSQCFLPFRELSAIFIKFKCLQSLFVWKSPKFVIWERDIN